MTKNEGDNVIEHTAIGNVDITLDTRRLDKNLREAQKLLNMQITADCDPLIPFKGGALRGSLRYPEGLEGGVIEWNTPYAHYQYMGEVYGPNIPIRDAEGNITGYWSPPSKEPTGRHLTYHQPGTTDHWFEAAKERHKADWIRLVQEVVWKG